MSSTPTVPIITHPEWLSWIELQYELRNAQFDQG